jgi:membrane protease YdiL (CAAX protease family)
MRALAAFLAVLFGTLLAAAVLAWPVWLLAHALEPDWPFHRVVSRLWQLLLLAALLLTLRRLGLRGREDWGYGLPRPLFLRHCAAGLAIGVGTMLPISLMLVALGLLAPEPDFGAAALLEAAAAGGAAGMIVALLEETFFRGLMFRAVSREAGVLFAAWATALVYSAVHFLASARIPADELGWTSGLELLAAALANYARPAAIADSFVTLVLVGLLLALVRARTGAIAAGIGLHMGWVAVIKTTASVTAPAGDSRWSFLVGSFDGYTGWLVAGWAALLFVVARSRGWIGVKAP